MVSGESKLVMRRAVLCIAQYDIRYTQYENVRGFFEVEEFISTEGHSSKESV